MLFWGANGLRVSLGLFEHWSRLVISIATNECGDLLQFNQFNIPGGLTDRQQVMTYDLCSGSHVLSSRGYMYSGTMTVDLGGIP